jgi:GT2 family glycosyltransferase
LIVSKNIGISNAMRRVLSMYNDCIVALSNDDIFYEHDWLVKQMEILKAYPNVGTVSGVTTRFYMGKAVVLARFDTRICKSLARSTRH